MFPPGLGIKTGGDPQSNHNYFWNNLLRLLVYAVWKIALALSRGRRDILTPETQLSLQTFGYLEIMSSMPST
jgi:hypothetical protein